MGFLWFSSGGDVLQMDSRASCDESVPPSNRKARVGQCQPTVPNRPKGCLQKERCPGVLVASRASLACLFGGSFFTMVNDQK